MIFLKTVYRLGRLILGKTTMAVPAEDNWHKVSSAEGNTLRTVSVVVHGVICFKLLTYMQMCGLANLPDLKERMSMIKTNVPDLRRRKLP
jgi:hypothetical protein